MRPEPYIVTHSGRRVSLVEPQARDIDIGDLAHHQALLNRFGGATKQPYCVAQHSMLVAYILKLAGHGARIQLIGLLHDGKEFVIGDIMSPVKARLFGRPAAPSVLDKLEGHIDLAIYDRFGIAEPTLEELRAVAEADHVALATEWRDLMPRNEPCPIDAEPIFRMIVPQHWEFARRKFLALFHDLMREAQITIPAMEELA